MQFAAAESHPPADAYGDRAGCERLMAEIQRGRMLLELRKDVLGEIRVRADALRAIARYRQAGDVVPEAESLSDDKLEVASRVLLDDTWDIARVLLR
jgi:hypothetical protein